LGIDGYGGAFAEAPGHRIGKAMAAEPSPTTVVGVIFYVLPRMGLTPHTLSRTSDAEGDVGDALHLSNDASKGKRGGRTVPLNKELRAALIALKTTRNDPEATDRIIHSERDIGLSAGAMQVWFRRLYESLGFKGASSHSGRRTFVTRCAKKIIEAGGWLRDVQELAGHASRATTQRYIQGNTDAKRRVVDL
jgi:integrase